MTLLALIPLLVTRDNMLHLAKLHYNLVRSTLERFTSPLMIDESVNTHTHTQDVSNVSHEMLSFEDIDNDKPQLSIYLQHQRR